MNKERKNNLIFEIWSYDKFGQLVETRKFHETRVMDFYIRWCSPKDSRYVFIKDISLPLVLTLAKYERVNKTTWVML